ncbi:MAG TPA: tetratricopeptide repeat protein [Cryomorphaceae bacterium]|nr:tetratricopeptide repeat protein [Cryomorphaceae bacterium]
MAKKKNQSEETIVDVQEVYSKTERYVDENRNTIIIVAALLVALFAGYFAFTRLYLMPKNEEGMNLLWKAEYWYEIDSLNKALVGNESYYGFEYIADEYDGTQAGELASYYSGIIYLDQGEYGLAIEYLKDADLDDELTSAVAKGAIGDAYVELGNLDDALNYFNDAIETSSNLLTTPIYLKKAALVHVENGNFDKALANFKRIKEEFPNSSEARNIDSYIAHYGG